MVFSVLMVLFVFLFSFASDVSRNIHLKKERLSAMEVSDSLALYINLVYQAGEGSFLNVSLNPRIMESTYNISVSGSNLLVFWDASHFSSPLLTDSVALTVSNSTDLIISNRAGVVVLE